MHDTAYIGDWLRTNRRSKGIKQNELGEFTGLKRTTIADLERNKCKPSSRALGILLNFFNELNSKETMKDDFERFGPEWRKTLMKHSLPSLVELFKPEPNSWKTKDELISQIRVNLVVKKFNEEHPVDSVVYWKSYVGAMAKPMTIQSNAFKHNDSAVCYFKERSGFCCIEPNFLEG